MKLIFNDLEDLNFPEDPRTDELSATFAADLDLTNTNLTVAVANIDSYANEDYAILRKGGLGTSDSSKVLDVNPYESRYDLIAEKIRPQLTQDEIALSDNLAVQKGNMLEPLIMSKFGDVFSVNMIKPIHLYAHNEYDFLRFNYDGVTGNAEQYIPVEIKVCTAKGEKHYNFTKSYYNDKYGFQTEQPDITTKTTDIKTKAQHYGVPVYYYTQLQQQILGLNSAYGYLAVLVERTWQLFVFLIHKDVRVHNQQILEGFKSSQIIEQKRNW